MKIQMTLVLDDQDLDEETIESVKDSLGEVIDDATSGGLRFGTINSRWSRQPIGIWVKL